MDNNTQVYKIAIVGPESTGKSTMSKYLAEHYHTIWVPEYAREYCEKLTADPTIEDEVSMFYGQLQLEQELLPQANKILICDTTFITVKIWSDHMFGYTPDVVLHKLPDHFYDLYLLLDIDMPWEHDPLRNFPDLREHFMKIWNEELKAISANYTIISGFGQPRYDQAIATIDQFLQSHQ